MCLFKKFKQVNPQCNTVCVDIKQTSGKSVFDKSLNVLQIAGWSDKIFNLIEVNCKGYEALIKQFKVCLEKGLDLNLKIVGSGKLQAYLEKLVIDWSREKGILAKATPIKQAMKTQEELTELCNAILNDDRDEIKDAITTHNCCDSTGHPYLRKQLCLRWRKET